MFSPTGAVVSVWMAAEAGELELAKSESGAWVASGERLPVTRVGEGAQIELTELEPDTAYCIVARAEGLRSSVTRFRTALAEDGFRQMTIGATSCLHSNRPWRNMSEVAATRPDVFMLLGDTVYADGATSLDDYRWHWRRALTVQGLIDVSSQTSVRDLDDHEVTNDFAGLNAAQRVEAALVAEAIPRTGPGAALQSSRGGGPQTSSFSMAAGSGMGTRSTSRGSRWIGSRLAFSRAMLALSSS